MNIKEIMEREIAKAERMERDWHERETTDGDDCGMPWLAIFAWAAVALAALCAAFAAGSAWQSRRDLNASREFAAWCDRSEHAAAERARAMGTKEILAAAEVRTPENNR